MSRRERHRRRHRRHSRARPLLLGLGILVASLAIAAVAAVVYVLGVASSGPSLGDLRPVSQGQSSIVYAADGTRLGFISSPILRERISGAQIAPVMREATVAVEDRRFFDHKGVDYIGIVRAAIKDLRSHEPLQGGSTLTMQLIKNIYPGESANRDFKTKVREAKLAQEMESKHPGRAGKEWILTSYLNNVQYGTAGGQEAIGVQAAARIFFDTTASRLTLPQAALLAGLPQAPTLYNPHYAPGAALHRRNEVLDKMAEQGYVTAAQARAAKASPLGVKQSRYYTQRREGYFLDYITDQLTAQYGPDRVQRGGMHIHTTLDLGLQAAARAALAKGIAGTDRDAALVTIDPSTGYILAMASSREYGDLQFNLATQGRRQAGSTFKVMALMTALKRGVDPAATSYISMPLKFTDPVWGPIDVHTYENTYIGRANLVRATLRSDNSIYMQLDLDLGPKSVAETAREMGITSPLHGYPSEVLGTASVSPLEMARAYASIANGGYRVDPIAVTKVIFPGGKVEVPFPVQRTKIFTDGETAKATDVLEQNIRYGTGTAADIGCPAAGKTGTTDDFTDAWFVGYTPRLATSVWVGHADSRASMPNGSGGVVAAPIWGAYMKVAKGGFCGQFPKPTEPFVAVPWNGPLSKYGPKGNALQAGQDAPAQPTTTAAPPPSSNGGSAAPPETGAPSTPSAVGGAGPPAASATGGAQPG
ncbi:MAG TPA: transglycosylase domain-containing protein [Solirubrobacteraceae bacterium]|nr:transglycosylase domain-containing protein [Solirubrobacteraceae bacterium]